MARLRNFFNRFGLYSDYGAHDLVAHESSPPDYDPDGGGYCGPGCRLCNPESMDERRDRIGRPDGLDDTTKKDV